MDLCFRQFKSNGVLFKIPELTKCSGPKRPLKELFLVSFPPDRKLCFVKYLKRYEKVTERLRNNNDICKMIEFLVDNIYVRFGGQLFRQMVGIPMGTNCALLLADLFLYSYENEFLDKLIKEGKRKLARRFNLSYRYIDDLISFNNKRFKEFISDIYLKELTISETTESASVASYLDLLFTRDRSNNITTKLYDKRDAFGFHIVNFPFMSSNIPSAPAYGVYASQLVRYARCCSNYSDFLICHRALVKRLLSQGYKVNRLSNTFKKFYGRHTDLVGQYKKNVCQMFADSIS